VNKNRMDDNMKVWSVMVVVVGMYFPLIGSHMPFL